MNDKEKFDKWHDKMTPLFDAMKEQVSADEFERKFMITRHLGSNEGGDVYASFGKRKINKNIVGCLNWCEALEEDEFLEGLEYGGSGTTKYRITNNFCDLILDS